MGVRALCRADEFWEENRLLFKSANTGGEFLANVGILSRKTMGSTSEELQE